MTPADIDRVFGRSRLRMVTGEHVEVFREEALPGERRRYTKRFLSTAAGDFRQWTEREWRILARLVGHGIGPVPDVVQFDRGASDRPALVQTYDAGVTVDHWATLLPVERDGVVLRHVFEDCAHWWALARHCLVALDAIHQLQLVHLDLKADNVCIPAGPADFDPQVSGGLLHLRFEQIALIDFAFSLVSGERLVSALPIARQTEYDYQSPRLLHALEAGARGDLGPTRQLDWRCDIFSLAAMLRRYLPDPDCAPSCGWRVERHALARALVRRLLEVHDAALPVERPHAELIGLASDPLQAADLAESLQRGWTLAAERPHAIVDLPTPVTRIAMPVPTPISMPTGLGPDPITIDPGDIPSRPPAVVRGTGLVRRGVAWTAGVLAIAAIGVPVLGETWRAWQERSAAASAGDAQADAKIAPAPTGTPAAGDEVARADPVVIVPPAAAPAASTPAMASSGAPGSTDAPTTTSTAVPTTAPTSVAQHDVEARAAAPSTDAGLAAPSPDAARSRDASGSAARTVTAPSPRRADEHSTPALAASKSRAGRSVNGRATIARSGPTATTSAAVTAAEPAARHGGHAAARQAMRAGSAGASGAGSGTRSAGAAAGRGMPAAAAKTAAASGQRPMTVGAPDRKVAQARPSAPLAPRAPTPWPHTAMASGIGNARSTTESRFPSPAQPAVPDPERGSAPAAVATLPPGGLPTPTGRTAEAPGNPAPSGTEGRAISESPSTRTAPPAFVPSPPAVVATAATATADRAPPLSRDFGARAADLLANQLPRIAQRAERSVMRVLFVAARADDAAHNDDVRQAAAAMQRPAEDALLDAGVAPNDARLLNEAARVAFWRRGSAREAADLQTRAFGANPADPEVVGNLAFLRLKQQPAQPEVARQLALHALTLQDARFPHGRVEDWTTLAIASALAGRERDARNAWWVAAALAPSIQRQCRAATDAYALYGERLRSSVEALLYRLHASGHLDGSPYCSWPPYWTVGAVR